jgi:hypothetical protein
LDNNMRPRLINIRDMGRLELDYANFKDKIEVPIEA